MYLIMVTIQIPYKDSSVALCYRQKYLKSQAPKVLLSRVERVIVVVVCIYVYRHKTTGKQLRNMLRYLWFSSRPGFDPSDTSLALPNTYQSFDVMKTSFLCKFPSLKTSARASPICSSFPYKCAPSMCLYPYCSASLTALRSSPSVASHVLINAKS